jgi:uncharacterized membrane protein YjgN (DUF898 family)
MDQAQPISTNPPPPASHALTFHARRGPFAGLLMTNALLTILTLGIYRFWAKTRIRRFFWHNVSFLDDPLEYTGTGGELFVGFLIVVAVLFPLGLIYSAIGALVPPDHPELRAALEIAYYIVLFALLQIGFYRMWRYRMSRTRWRGVRFGLDGSTWAYLKLSAGWSVLTALSLGAAYPWMQIDLWRYQIRHTRLGDTSFRFDGNARELVSAWAPTFIIAIAIAATGGLFVYHFGWDGAGISGGMPDDEKHLLAGLVATIAGLALLSTVTFFYYRIRQTRLQISGIRFGDARFASAMPFGRLLLYALGCFVLAGGVVLAAFLAATAFGSIDQFWDMGFQMNMESGSLGALIATIVVVFLIFPLIWALIFKFEVIRQTVITTAIANPHELEHAAQTADRGPRTGEGLADALDIGGF